jgi:putative flavoprotein involved in K+ transport
MSNGRNVERVQAVVIGGGQAGLSVGHYLKQHGISFVILEAHKRIGDSWRGRWDSLRLFTPARFDGLAGLPFPAPANAFPTKNEMGDYLERYAAHFQLPVRVGAKVDRLSKEGNQYVVRAGTRRFEADHVVVAMANYQTPRVPSFACELDPAIVQMHSLDYRNPRQLREGGVLLVGAGNSGAEIALEAARAGHATWMSGRATGHVPFQLGGFAGRLFLTRFVLRFVFHRVLTLGTPLGRKRRPRIVSKGTPLIRIKPNELASAGVERTPRTVGVRDGKPLLEDGRVLDVSNVIWCTGFDPGCGSWVDLPIFDANGEPTHERGVVTTEPGLYFVGLHFLYAMSSTMIHGVGRDAKHVADTIAARIRARPIAVELQPALQMRTRVLET